MHKDEVRTELGNIKIHDNVIINIATLAACDVAGVKGIDQSIKGRIINLISGKTITAIGVSVDAASQISLEIPLVIFYGYSVSEVASKVQDSVKSTIERLTNLAVKDVHIKIKNVVRR